MSKPIRVKKGLDIKLKGRPQPAVVDAARPSSISVHPSEFHTIKAKLHVEEGDPVKIGTPLFYNKKDERFVFRSPAAGTVREIKYGKRRVIDDIVIDIAQQEDAEALDKFDAHKIASLSRDDVLLHLLGTGLFSLIRQRPFSHMADPAAMPKSIFVNAMSSAPFQADFTTVVKGDEEAFQAGLSVLTRLTDGAVHLCAKEGDQNADAIENAKGVSVHTFEGPHPAGNTSVHIQSVDPLRLQEVIWYTRATDVILIGKLFLEGRMPTSRIIAVGGPGIKEDACKHYRVRLGAPLATILDSQYVEGEQRVIEGDMLAGTQVRTDSSLLFRTNSVTVLPEGREREFMGWMAPGFNIFSASHAFVSRWLPAFRREWALTSSRHGSHRAMVLTGLYDKYMPLDVMVDFLVRAVIAHDTDEAVKLGILETDPEDFALCSFVCPSKTDIMSIIQSGLKEIEKEGL